MIEFLRRLFSPRLGVNGSAASTPDVREAWPARDEVTTSELHDPEPPHNKSQA